MAIPEDQLETWSHQGATVGSANTHKSIRVALDQHSWPEGMNYDVYLQGSYRNHTNIRGNSDVDVVIEARSVCNYNLNEYQKRLLGIRTGSYNYWDFRNEVLQALASHYGANSVDAYGQKSIKIGSSSNRLAADVVPCITYRRYHDLQVFTEGITFWTLNSNQQIINYPKLHFQNGVHKNERANNYYKPVVRMFKNARERILADNSSLQGNYPSYFVECLLYNVPDDCFSNRFADTYCDVVTFLLSENSQHLTEFWCQNEQMLLFGNHPTQWDITQAQDFINQLCILWEQWQ